MLALVWRPEQEVGQALSGDTRPLGLSLLYVFAYCSLFIGCHSQCGGKNYNISRIPCLALVHFHINRCFFKTRGGEKLFCPPLCCYLVWCLSGRRGSKLAVPPPRQGVGERGECTRAGGHRECERLPGRHKRSRASCGQ